MEKMISFCGISCSECPVFLATQKNDNNERKKVAEEWSESYNMELKLEDINCDGCLVETGRLFGHCKVCEIRKCGIEKNVKNCAYCIDFPCQKLDDFFIKMAYGKANLEEIRKNL